MNNNIVVISSFHINFLSFADWLSLSTRRRQRTAWSSLPTRKRIRGLRTENAPFCNWTRPMWYTLLHELNGQQCITVLHQQNTLTWLFSYYECCTILCTSSKDFFLAHILIISSKSSIVLFASFDYIGT